MNEVKRQPDNLNQDWQRMDDRVLEQLLAAQNLLFVLPDEARIAEFFSEALSKVPGVTSSFVCLGNMAAPVGAGSEVCSECMALRKKEGEMLVMPLHFSCGWVDRQDFRVIRLNTTEHTFGFFIFRTDARGVLEPYWPFLNNLANYVALSLENRMQKLLLEQARDELEDRVEKRTEELKQMNERFSLAARAARLGVWDWDLQKNELVWDDRMYELNGGKREDFAAAYEAWLQGVHPDDRTFSDEISKQAQRGERPYDTEFRVVWPDKTIHYLKACGQFVRDEDGKPLRMTGINYDITDRKRAEEALVVQEREYRTLVENIPDLIVRYDTDLRRTFVNPAWEKTSGLSKAEVINVPPADIPKVPQPIVDAYLNKLRSVLETGTSQTLEFSWVNAQGVTLFLHYIMVPEYGQNGEIVGVLAVGHDITARKQAEEGLQQAAEEIRDLYNHAPCGYHSLNSDGVFIQINDTELQWIGYTRDETVGKMRFTDLITEKSRQTFKDNFPLFKERGWVRDLEFELIRKDGTRRPVLVSATAIYDDAGNYVMSRSTVYDISKRKQTEEKLQERERHSQSLLRLSRNLERAQTYGDVLNAAQDEVRIVIGYQTLWAYLFSADKGQARALFAEGPMADMVLTGEGVATLTIKGDRMLEEIVAARDIVVIEDARTDERTNKEIVAWLGNRTIINVPIMLFDRHMGSIGTGTFGDEGVHIPTQSEEEYLRTLASHMAVTLDRIHLLEQRKKTEAALRESEEKYRLLHENAGVGIGYYTPDGKVISYNQLAASHMQGQPEDFNGKSLYDIFPKQEADVYMDRIRHSLAAESALVYEDHLTLPLGETWFLSTLTKICDSQKNVVGVQIISQDITERRQIEAQLQESETRFRSFVEKANDVIYTVSPDGVFVYVSPNWKELLGHEISEVEGQLFESFVHPEDLAACRLMLNRVMVSGEKVSGFEYRVQHKNGGWQWQASNASAIYDANGRIVSFLGIARNITKLKQAEQERLAHLQFFESMDQINRAIQGASDLEQMMSNVLQIVLSVFDCDRTWLFHPCDPDASSFRVPMEINKPEYPGAGVLNVDVPMPLDMAQDLREALESAVPVTFTMGTEKPINKVSAEQFGVKSMMMVALCPKLGKPWAFGLHQCSYPRAWTPDEQRLFQEIGRRLTDALTSLLAYRDLQDSEQRYRTLFNVMDEGVAINEIVRDEQGNVVDYVILEVNPAFTQNSVYTAADVIGGRATDLYQMRPEFIREWWRKHAQLQQVIHTEMYHEPSGRWFHITTTPPTGNRFATFSTDITDRKSTEAEIRHFNQELEQRVRDRTTQLEAVNKELEAFAYSVSHDLRTPLRHIDGFLELLQQQINGDLNERSQHYMNAISDAARRMGQLIDDLLAFSRMGRHELSKTPIDLDGLIQEVIRELAPEIHGRSIHWQITSLPTITGDRAMLRQALVNLFANALKFTRQRQPAEIEIGWLPGQDNEIIVFIRDNGVGFEMAYADKLFGVFQRLHHADEFEGTGIGLASVRRIVDRHGGRVWAEGHVNQGATFYVSLPHKLKDN